MKRTMFAVVLACILAALWAAPVLANPLTCGSGDQSTIVQAHLDTNAGGLATFNAGDCRIDSGVSVPANTKVQATGVRFWTNNNIDMVGLDSGVTVKGLEVDGGEYGFYAEGANAQNYLSNIQLIDTTVRNQSDTGVYLRFAEDVLVDNLDAYDIEYAGINGDSVTRMTVQNSLIDGVGVGGSAGDNAYGVLFSRMAPDSDLNKNPLPRDSKVKNSTIKNIPTWEGLDNHAGVNIEFSGNVVENAASPIVVTKSHQNGNDDYTAQNVTIKDNIIRNPSSMYRRSAIIVGGTWDSSVQDHPAIPNGDPSYVHNVVVSGNTVHEYGERGPDAIDIFRAKNVQANDNRVILRRG